MSALDDTGLLVSVNKKEEGKLEKRCKSRQRDSDFYRMLTNLMFYASIKSSKAMLTFCGLEMLSAISKRLQCARSKLSATSKAFTYSQLVGPESLRCFSHIVALLMESFHPKCVPTPFYCNWLNCGVHEFSFKKWLYFCSSLLNLPCLLLHILHVIRLSLVSMK